MYEASYADRVLLAGRQHLVVYDRTTGRVLSHAEARPVTPCTESLLYVQAADGATPQPRGSLPPAASVASWAPDFRWVVLMHHHLYRPPGSGIPNSAPPYHPIDEKGLLKFNAACLKNDIYSLAYISPFDYARTTDRPDWEWFIRHCHNLLTRYGYRGFYVDGLLFDYNQYKLDNPAQSLHIARALREITGPDGVLVGHLSHGNQPAAFLPDIDRIFTAVVRGEGYVVVDLHDPYLMNEISTVRWTGVPVGWLNSGTLDRLTQTYVPKAITQWQVRQGMIGISYAHQIKDDRGFYNWLDGRTRYWKTWKQALDAAKVRRDVTAKVI